jgi:hypothetical protein
MHGPGYAPPPPHRPSQGVQITLRVIFVALAVMSCGVFAWAGLLRLACVTRKKLDWAVFVLGIVHIVLVITLLAADPGEDEFTTWRGDIGMWLLLVGMVLSIAYYLYADIRHFGPNGAAYAQTTGGYAQTTGGYAQSPGGYARPQTGYGYPAAPQPFPPAPPVGQQPPAQPPVPPQPRVQPQRPAPARIDQVRAELDELSEYLRKHEGGR